MNNGYTKEIRERILSFEEGTVFIMSDFADIADATTIRQSLSRLVKSGKIQRILNGVFVMIMYYTSNNFSFIIFSPRAKL